MTVTQIVTCDGCGKRQQEGEHFWLVQIEFAPFSPLYIHVHNWVCFTNYGITRSAEYNLASPGRLDAYEA